MFDFQQMGRLMELAREIDTDDLVELAEKVDLPELIRVVRNLDDAQLKHFEEEVRRAAGGTETERSVDPSPQYHLPVRRAAVLGAGTMGGQIAAHLANVGVEVILLDMPSDEDDRDAIARKGLEKARAMKPAPFYVKDAASRITVGNFDDDMAAVAAADWIIEAVIERLDVKRSLMERIEGHASDSAIVSTNTSGIPIHEIAAGRSESFRRRFLGTHFFNPPRYLKLLELIPTADTAQDVVERVAAFGRIHLGKGVVIAKDVPYFIGNRIGVYAQLQALRYFTRGEYSIEEIDLLTGTLVGRPKSATFRTADVVGLDVLESVAENLHEKAVDDESRQAFKTPDLLSRLVQKGALGAKSGAGFYRKVGKDILSVDPESLEYRPAPDTNLREIDSLKTLSLEERLRTLYDRKGRAGQFFRETILDVLAYAARRIPEITDNPADVDRAIRWGFGWQHGPFETWDLIGFAKVKSDMEKADIPLPDWIQDLEPGDRSAFYREKDGEGVVYSPSAKGYSADTMFRDELPLASIRSTSDAVLGQSEEANLLDIGEGVALFEFRSRGNSLGMNVMRSLRECIDLVEERSDIRGLLVGNDGKNFSVGANLFEVATAVEKGDFSALERAIASFQETIMRVRYALKPVVVAVHQRALGGACEMLMACDNQVASAESYIGLVELGVGLIPGGTGSTHLAALASERAAGGHPSEVQAHLQGLYENVAMARVAESAYQAREMGYLSDCSTIVMHEDRRLFAARAKVVELSEVGYYPPPRRDAIQILGRATRAAFEVQLQQYLEGHFISEYDRYLGSQLALVMTGGEVSGPQFVSEEYLLDLEREVILRLFGKEETQARIQHMLATGKPLRN